MTTAAETGHAEAKDLPKMENALVPVETTSLGRILPDWTINEERKVRLKIDLILMPVLILAFFTLQMDRGNISNVLTSTILEDLKITTNDINVGTQLLLVGIVILELPSNILMQWVQPHYYLSIQIFAWGCVATFQSFITNRAEFLATRFLLGLFEAGFVPGALFYMTTWYTRHETSSRVAFYYVGQNLALACTSLIAAGILKLEGAAGWAGWRWIWTIEGAATLLVAVMFLLLLPPGLNKRRPLISFGRWSYFSKREQHILLHRLQLDDSTRGEDRAKITAKDLLNSFKDYKLWLHVAATMTTTCAVHGLTIYTPSMIKKFGWSSVHANALSSVYGFLGMFFNIATAIASDKTGYRGPFVLLAATWSLIAWSCLTTVVNLTNQWHKYVTLMLANVCATSVHILNVGWLTVHATSPQDRSIRSAMIIIAANLGGLSGGNIYSKDDAPNYSRGIRVMVAIGAACWALAAILGLAYYLEDRKMGKATVTTIVADEDTPDEKAE